ncbi:MAG: energy transducer TonB [bacterium]
MKKYQLLLLLLLMINLSLMAEANRPGIYGFAPSYPEKVPEIFSSDVKSPSLTRETEFILLLTIDNNGKVSDINVADDKDHQAGEYARQFLTNCSFVPALLNNNKVTSILPIKFRINPRIQTPDFKFPIDSEFNIADPDFYYYTFGFNNISLPEINYFPKYFCNIDWNDSLDLYPYILLRLDLDEKGEVKNVKEILSTYSNYTTTLMSASLWSEFIPAKVNDSNIACSSYLLISLFPQIYYPTQKYYNNQSDTLSIHDKTRLKIIPDTINIIQKPIPRSVEGDNIRISNIPRRLIDTLGLYVTVDTSGMAKIIRAGKTSKDTYRIMHEVFSRVKFYPAIGFDGKPVKYDGLLQLIINGSEKVRIKYLW